MISSPHLHVGHFQNLGKESVAKRLEKSLGGASASVNSSDLSLPSTAVAKMCKRK
jgi:hypothetical protein